MFKGLWLWFKKMGLMSYSKELYNLVVINGADYNEAVDYLLNKKVI